MSSCRGLDCLGAAQYWIALGRTSSPQVYQRPLSSYIPTLEASNETQQRGRTPRVIGSYNFVVYGVNMAE
jgi:hypothetical protein